MSLSLGKIGAILTAAYLLLLGTTVLYFWPHYQTLAANAWGDFLAGAFGPLALAWIVLGFFLQGRELQNSVEQIKLQTKELKHSVDVQKQMAASASSDLEFQQQYQTQERWLEAKKLEIRISLFTESVANELPVAKKSRHAVLAATGMRHSGAKIKFDEWLRDLGERVDSIEERHRKVTPIPSLDAGGPSVETLAELFRLSGECSIIETEIAEQKRQNEEKRREIREEYRAAQNGK